MIVVTSMTTSAGSTAAGGAISGCPGISHSASQVNASKEGSRTVYSFRESAILEHKAHNVLLFCVEWREGPGGRRVVESAAFRATKCRSGPLFELTVDYEPELYAITDAGEQAPAAARLPYADREDLRDAVWMPAYLSFHNGGEVVALVPTRYPGSQASADGLIQLSRKTEWREASAGRWVGLGQRVLTTDAGEFDLMAVRSIELQAGPDEAAAEGAPGA